LLDENGPGALTRLWLTTGFGTSSCIDPATRIRFYVDGAIMPTLDVALAQLFDGSTPPFTPPLVADRAQSSGGYVSRMPIAYAQSLRVALTNAQGTGNPCSADGRRLLWYQFQHHRVAPGASIASFDETSDEPAWRAFLEHAGDDPWNGLLAPIDTTATLAANASVTLDARNDSGWLRGIRLHLPRAAYGAVSLRVRIDGDVAFDMPLADFFATAADAQRPARGVLVGEDASGWLYAWFPMPFAMSASVELHADASLPSPVAVDASLVFDNAAVPAQAGRFNASLADDCVAAGSFAFDDVRGAGKIVGVAARYHADGVANRGYLEGDERAFVDDASAPAWYGTGIEDFFDGGFYFDHGAFAGPLSGATRVDADGSGVTAAYRLMLADALPYAGALRMTQEAGFSSTQPVAACARRVVYAYRQTKPLQIAYDAFEIGDAAAAAAHDHVAAADAQCQSLSAAFEGGAIAQRARVRRHERRDPLQLSCRRLEPAVAFAAHVRRGHGKSGCRRRFRGRAHLRQRCARWIVRASRLEPRTSLATAGCAAECAGGQRHARHRHRARRVGACAAVRRIALGAARRMEGRHLRRWFRRRRPKCASLQVGANQLGDGGEFPIALLLVSLGSHVFLQVRAQHFRHESVHCAANGRDLHQGLRAIAAFLQRRFQCRQLPLDLANPTQQLLLIPLDMRHDAGSYTLWGYILLVSRHAIRKFSRRRGTSPRAFPSVRYGQSSGRAQHASGDGADRGDDGDRDRRRLVVQLHGGAR
jgi:hypothetical protein